MPDLELRNYFEFDEGDLAANRAGRLTEKQEIKLAEADSGANRIALWVGVFFILFAMGASYVILKPVLEAGWRYVNIQDVVASVFFLLVIWGLLGYFGIRAIRRSSNKTDYSVQTVKGKVNFVRVEAQVRRPSGNGYKTEQQYELRVGRFTFEDVDEELLNIIEEGDTYAFYIVEDTQDILSCEFISKGK